ncbi:hypothetical protein FB451DRAFT_1260410 [Mycena latifolia]|nr:hypothetical protein FB451DRAFT_1260410 [Mycena latifolia]
MLHFKEFTAWVSIDGNEALEYGIETSEDQKSVTCWIASELGKTFIVNWTNSSYSQEAVHGRINMDGNLCAGHFMDKALAGGLPLTARNGGVTDGTTLRAFTFSSLELTDDDTLLGDASHPELGTITLTICPARKKHDGSKGGHSFPDIRVHERAKKAVTQQITLGESKQLVNPVRVFTVQRIGPDLAKFCFKYRPLDVLQANGIAPLPPRNAEPKPERALTPDDPEALARAAEEAKILAETTNEARALREQLAAVEAKLAQMEKPRVKREADPSEVVDLTQDTRKRVKRESKQPFIPGEVIDLT